MKAGKVLLLATVLGAGASIEVAHAVRAHISIGPWGCRVLGGRFDGPSFTFEQEQTLPASGELSLRVENAFGGVHVAAGAPDAVRLRMRKVVFLADEARAREFAARI
jgi:hypothetical protein